MRISLVGRPAGSTYNSNHFEINYENDVDYVRNIEYINLSQRSDKVLLLGDLDDFDNEGPTVVMGLSPYVVGQDQDQVDATGLSKGIHLDMRSGYAEGLDNEIDRGFAASMGRLALSNIAFFGLNSSDLSISGASSGKGTAYSDILVGSSGMRNSGEGFSTLYGEGGGDFLVARGRETHMTGVPEGTPLS